MLDIWRWKEPASCCVEAYGKKKITVGLYKVTTSITFQFNIFHSFDEFQDICVITWKFLTGIFQLWKNYEISTEVSFSLQYQTK